ncbi:sortase [Actinomadura sp. NBRC 104412]|uniref:class E sortase n=1 Tax=Actinomadura sp. NBRC 104412 TaxID=3032203 RepID=UPI0024A1AAD2|nr:class E sortase [Actinomadura sp. NBRC 104412]GLZ05257.1 sortase [Actinomadura sp. NBRC 104412]
MTEAISTESAPDSPPDGASHRPREERPGTTRRPAPWHPRRIGVVAGVWLLVTVMCAGLLAYGLGPLLESRQQRALLGDFRARIAEVVGQRQSLFGRVDKPRAAELGEPVAIIQIPRMRLQQVVVEGADSERTQAGPGHVPGTAGPGQPGNSAVVGRRHGFGAPFRTLDTLRPGDDIIVTTTQGQTLYKVLSVGRANLAVRDVYASSTDDRLTLVSSWTWTPWERHRSLVVVAKATGLPFPPTPQGARSRHQDGRHGDPSAVPLMVLYGVLFAGSAVASVLLYRWWLTLSTYVLTTPVMVALIVLAAEAGTRLLPAWI